MKKLFFVGVFTTFFYFYFANGVAAHGEGATFEKEVDGYLIDIGYEPEEFQVGREPSVFDFNVLDPETNEEVEFTDIWVRITKDDQTFLANGISKASLGRTTLTYLFQEAGVYELSVRFENEGEPFAKTSFPLQIVETQSPAFSNNLLLGGLTGIIIGSLLTYVLIKGKAKKSDEN